MAVALAYSVLGKANLAAPPIAILHGVFGQKRNWRTVGQQLSDRLKRRVYLLDARNHGDSPSTDAMTYEAMSGDVLRFLDDHSIPQCTLIGHSMGGKTAMFSAVSYPARVDSLVVVDVAPTRAPGTRETRNSVDALCGINLDTVTAKKDLEDSLSDQIPDKHMRQFLLTNLERCNETKKYSWRVNLKAISSYLQTLKAFPFTKQSYPGSTLFIGGGDSIYITSADEPEIGRLFPSSSVQFIRGAGHWVHTDKPKEFVQAVTQFLEPPTSSSNQ